MEKATRTVALCGTAPSSRHLANEQGPDVEIWALNDCWSFLERSDRWFEIHERTIWESDGEKHVQFLREYPGSVYMLDHYEDIPNSVRYPFEAIRDEFSPGAKLPYLASTIDYMIALAIYEEYDTIKLYGINMATNTEYVHQRPSCEYWLGIAQGRGINVVLPDVCPLLTAPIYGVERPQYITPEMLRTRKQRVQFQKQKLEAELNAVSGAIQAFEQLESVLGEPKLTEPEREATYQPPQLVNVNGRVGDVDFAGVADGID